MFRTPTILALTLFSTSAAFATQPKPPATTPPVNNYSPHNDVQQSMGQLQGQAQGLWNTNKINTSAGAAASSGSSALGIGQGGGGGGGGGGGAGGNAANYGGDQRTRVNVDNSNHSVSINKQRFAPSVAFQGSSLGSGNPCEGLPFGIGGSSAVPNPFSAFLQIPRESGKCWGERTVTQGLIMRQQGIRISDNALLAIYAGVPVAQAINDNPYMGGSYYAPRRTKVRHAAKGRPCVPCQGRKH